jgi:hypothetical protein
MREDGSDVCSEAHYGLKSDIAPSPKDATGGHSITSSAVASSSGGTDLDRKVSRQPTPEELETGAYFADFDEYRSANGLTEERNVA